MSTRSSIGYSETGGHWHLYKECVDSNTVYLTDDDNLLRLMPEKVWEEMHQQIIADWLQQVLVGGAKLEAIWGTTSPITLDRKKLVAKFKELIDKVPN